MIPLAAMGVTAGALLLSRVDTAAETAEVELPIKALTRKQWLDFVRVCSNGNPRTVTPSFRLGVFELSVRRLCDLGAMENPRIAKYQGNQVWDADWRNPRNLRAFHDDPMAQYSLFADSMRRYADEAMVKDQIGQAIDGASMTLSGALIVAHRGGVPGLIAWTVDPSKREKHRTTVDYYQKGNGLF